MIMKLDMGRTKMPRLVLESPRQYTIFCFALIHHEWIKLPKLFHWLVPQSVVNNYWVLCTVKAKKSEQKHTTMNFVEFHTHTPLLTMTTAAYFMRTSYCSGSLFFLHFLGPHSTRNWNFVNLLTSVYDSLLVFLFRKLLVHLNNKSASEREANREARRPQSAFHKWCIFIIGLTFHFSSNFTAF